MMADQNMNDFLEVLSSSAPVPGGGGASAYAAAIGMSLGTMVANLTTGKKKYAEYQQEIEEVIVKSEALTKELVTYMDKDAEAFEPLSKAYGLPKNTPEELVVREEVMEKALVVASEAPLALMEKVLEAMKILERLAVIGSALAISDVGVGIQMAKAALNGASLNVFINTKLMKNEAVAEDMNSKADELLAEGNDLADEIFDAVMDRIR
ncbi:MAG: cyclodeaminase/cyclohydrolase family protein [Lachnospira sp.]|nr:cyclodeaminase/cyclohydrolase family protein [Lachnospira sp.]